MITSNPIEFRNNLPLLIKYEFSITWQTNHQEKTINGEYYPALLQQLNNSVKANRQLWQRKMYFSIAQTCSSAVAKTHELRLELLPHAPYSSGLASSDFSSSQIWTSGSLKKLLLQIRFKRCPSPRQTLNLTLPNHNNRNSNLEIFSRPFEGRNLKKSAICYS